MDVPPGECTQCWTHAYDKSIHRSQDPDKDCPECMNHLHNGHGNMIVPGKRSWW